MYLHVDTAGRQGVTHAMRAVRAKLEAILGEHAGIAAAAGSGPLALAACASEPCRRSSITTQRRDEIAQVACKVVAQYGFEQATVVRIARAAGYTTGMVAHYF